jgi:hypothetical protein
MFCLQWSWIWELTKIHFQTLWALATYYDLHVKCFVVQYTTSRRHVYVDAKCLQYIVRHAMGILSYMSWLFVEIVLYCIYFMYCIVYCKLTLLQKLCCHISRLPQTERQTKRTVRFLRFPAKIPTPHCQVWALHVWRN